MSENVEEQKSKRKSTSWLRNTYFWIALVLFLIGIAGVVKGDNFIRDPGQKPESNLWIFYFGAAFVALINGYLSHQLTLKQLRDEGQIEDEE